jgi:glucokinase
VDDRDLPVQIVADIGGTNARFALVPVDGTAVNSIEVFPCAEFPFLIDAITAYLGRRQVESLAGVCLAVAGPVASDWVDLPNNHWAFSRRELEDALAVEVRVINDFSAQVMGIDVLEPSELRWLGPARPAGSGVRAVVGPGTGLGVSALLPGGGILPSEGGHVAFAPVNDHQVALLKTLQRRYQRVSAERVLSGPGLANLYWANCRLQGVERELPAPEVTAGALAGDEYCLRAVTDFFSILAAFAGDLALMTGAIDGVYLSGGILPRMLDLLDEEAFLAAFRDKGRFRQFNERVPVAVVLGEHPGLRGCARALREGHSRRD